MGVCNVCSTPRCTYFLPRLSHHSWTTWESRSYVFASMSGAGLLTLMSSVRVLARCPCVHLWVMQTFQILSVHTHLPLHKCTHTWASWTPTSSMSVWTTCTTHKCIRPPCTSDLGIQWYSCVHLWLMQEFWITMYDESIGWPCVYIQSPTLLISVQNACTTHRSIHGQPRLPHYLWLCLRMSKPWGLELV